ncbi:MAG: hypothetical protein ACLFUH_10865 [Bacteroidales bacterium]
MKLIFCKECEDIVRLIPEETRYCQCGKSSGKYTDNLYAWYSGPCIPIGIANSSLAEALTNQPESGDGKKFNAFVIPKKCDTFSKI